MCCRYRIEKTPKIAEIIEEMNRSPLLNRWDGPAIGYGDIGPGNAAPAIASNRLGRRAVFPMKWGFKERTLLVNARAETAAQKPTFAESWATHRCILPASYYYEWEHASSAGGKGSVKYKIAPKDGDTAWLCGLYRIEEGLPAFVVLTREPWEGIKFIHDRMPLIMPEKLVNEWIRPDVKPEELLAEALTQMEYETDK